MDGAIHERRTRGRMGWHGTPPMCMCDKLRKPEILNTQTKLCRGNHRSGGITHVPLMAKSKPLVPNNKYVTQSGFHRQ